jgi:tRNA pseudouridine55 synthase
MELKARPLFVDSLIMLDRPDQDHVVLEMICGKGGYVRSIARDLGNSLGCYGHVINLRRIWAGPFKVANGLSFEQIEEMARTPKLDSHLVPLEVALEDLPQVPGMVISNDLSYGDACWTAVDGQAVAVGIYKSGELHPNRVFLHSGTSAILT